MNLAGNFTVELLSIDGRVLRRIMQNNEIKKFTLEVGDLKKGVYLYKISQGQQTIQLDKLILLNNE